MKRYLKYIAILPLLILAILLGLLYISMYTQRHPMIPTVTVGPSEVPNASIAETQQTPPDFYRTILDNNLFHPLGWRPSRPREPYRLLGTLIPCDGKSKARAILQKNTAGKIYTVMIGDTLDTDTTLIAIQSKQVILEKRGQRRILALNTTPWLK